MYDLAVQCALVEVPAIPGGSLKKNVSPSQLPVTIFTSQVAEK